MINSPGKSLELQEVVEEPFSKIWKKLDKYEQE